MNPCACTAVHITAHHLPLLVTTLDAPAGRASDANWSLGQATRLCTLKCCLTKVLVGGTRPLPLEPRLVGVHSRCSSTYIRFPNDCLNFYWPPLILNLGSAPGKNKSKDSIFIKPYAKTELNCLLHCMCIRIFVVYSFFFCILLFHLFKYAIFSVIAITFRDFACLTGHLIWWGL